MIFLLVPRGSSASSLGKLPPIVDSFTDQLTREILKRAFAGKWPSIN